MDKCVLHIFSQMIMWILLMSAITDHKGYSNDCTDCVDVSSY